IRGARQVGKTTLVRDLLDHGNFNYLTMDNAAVLSAASSDPTGFVNGLKTPVILDEVQRTPNLLLAIKEDVDRRRTAGRYLLTGSANVLAVPRVADSLAGRMEILTLWPLSQGEIAGVRESFIENLCGEKIEQKYYPQINIQELASRIVGGGFPEPLGRTAPARRDAWFGSYITTIAEREIRSISMIHEVATIPKLLRFLASRTAMIRDQAQIARSLGIPNTSLIRYLSMLEAVFFIYHLPAWTNNLGKRLVKAPKLYFTDTGVACHLLGLNAERLAGDPGSAGSLFENFIVSEICKQATWSNAKIRCFHFRSHLGHEVDLVLEDASGKIYGIEIKLAAAVTAKHFSGLKVLKTIAGGNFISGAVVYTGSQVVPFGRDLYAVPVSALWSK
ncbi:MAG: ATP-binding protein, partial [Syntrophales bacterium]|nr:ATP-binding protein [Syntrophales bacterium]